MGAPNGGGREDKTYKLSKKKSHPQGCQPDLNLGPESWRLPYQIQSCLARLLLSCAAWGRTDIMIKARVGAVAYLICCEYPAHPPADGSSTAKGSADTVLVSTLLFARCSSSLGPGFVVC
jgi:hypothetical protein